MKLYELWNHQYRQNRYLKDATDNEIDQRIKYLIENLTTLELNGKIGLSSPSGDSHFLMESFSHANEELRIRNRKPAQNFLKDSAIPTPQTDKSAKYKNLTLQVKSLNGELFKFGKKKYLLPSLKNGLFRISPAESYNDPSLNHAIKDDELSIELIAPKDEVKLTTMNGDPIIPVSDIKMEFQLPSNYYVFCLSETFNIRLFEDFEADSCLVINNANEFVKRMQTEFNKTVPGWMPIASPVEYVDPYRYSKNGRQPIVHISKHIRYFYQKEFRLIWDKQISKNTKLAHQHIYIKNMDEICHLVEL